MFRYCLLAGLLLLGACFSQKRLAREEAATYRYGATREAVLAAVKDRNELMVAEFNVPHGHLVAYQYSLYGKAGLKAPKYYLYFMNDTLIRKSGEEDLRRGAKIAVREYYYPEPAEEPKKKRKRK